MEDGWPSGVGLRGQAPNHPELRWLKTVVVSVRGKARLDRVRWGPGRRPRASEWGRCCLSRVSLLKHCEMNGGIETGGPCPAPGMSLAVDPECWPGGARCGGGVSLVCGSCTEHEKAYVDTDRQSQWVEVGPPGGERERAEGATEGTEYRCDVRWRTGP